MPEESKPKTLDELATRQIARELVVDGRFADIEQKLANQPTRQEFQDAMKGLANKEDIARLNNYVHTFTLGVQILEKSGKFLLYTVITIGGVAGGILVIKNGLLAFLAYFGFTRI